MSNRSDREYLIDICEAIYRIEKYTGGMTYDTFFQDTKTKKLSGEIYGEGTAQFHGKIWQGFGWEIVRVD